MIYTLIINLFISNLIVDLIYDFNIESLQFKPLNCSKCLGFWLGLTSILYTDPVSAITIASASYLINKILSNFIA